MVKFDDLQRNGFLVLIWLELEPPLRHCPDRIGRYIFINAPLGYPTCVEVVLRMENLSRTKVSHRGDVICILAPNARPESR